jgi:hypothetical protein
MDQWKTLKHDLHKIVRKLEAKGFHCFYIGIQPIDDYRVRLRLKAEAFKTMNRWDALTNISNLIFDMKEQGEISNESFLAIAAIDTLNDDTPVGDTIPLELFGLSEPELDHIKQLLFPKKHPLPPQYHLVP